MCEAWDILYTAVYMYHMYVMYITVYVLLHDVCTWYMYVYVCMYSCYIQHVHNKIYIYTLLLLL